MRRHNIFNGSSLGKIYGFSHLSSPSSNKSLCSSRQLSKPGWHKQDQLPRNMAVLLSEAWRAQGVPREGLGCKVLEVRNLAP